MEKNFFTILSRYRYRVAAIHTIVQFSQKFQENALEKRHGWERIMIFTVNLMLNLEM